MGAECPQHLRKPEENPSPRMELLWANSALTAPQLTLSITQPKLHGYDEFTKRP